MKALGIDGARAVALAALVLGLSCCGSGAADGSSPSSSATGGHDHVVGAVDAQAKESRRVPASGGCGAAVVRLGRSSGGIDFTLTCRAYPDTPKIHFAVGLIPVSSGKGVGISDYRRHLKVTEAGSESRKGTCSRYGGGLACSSRVDVKAAISGRLWVKRGSECNSKIVISESRPGQPCTEVCTSEAPAAVIVEARPRGC